MPLALGRLGGYNTGFACINFTIYPGEHSPQSQIKTGSTKAKRASMQREGKTCEQAARRKNVRQQNTTNRITQLRINRRANAVQRFFHQFEYYTHYTDDRAR